MKNVISEIKYKIEKLKFEFGIEDGIILMRAAFHGCYPHRPNGWDCPAIRVTDNTVEIGRVTWDFSEELEDASDYNWDFSTQDFDVENTFDLANEGDIEELNRELLG